jgi:hypothetical protein
MITKDVNCLLHERNNEAQLEEGINLAINLFLQSSEWSVTPSLVMKELPGKGFESSEESANSTLYISSIIGFHSRTRAFMNQFET